MRLIQTSDLKLVEFPFGLPPYAILSHTWGPPQDEVLLEDMQAGIKVAKSKAAFDKVESTCAIAREQGLEYCWIDTCCIDKKSSAELQEAINSMFVWYKKSAACYAYLGDVTIKDYNSESFIAQFESARWFTRGWTLQELIAPRDVTFYTKYWETIGTKSKELASLLSKVTGIPSSILEGRESLRLTSIAQRMSWASKRQTSRKEDMAYCLLGLFSVHMSMLYGEGSNAFTRLQLEIINNSDDDSIFAWLGPESNGDTRKGVGLLATHPRNFSRCGEIKRPVKLAAAEGEDPPSMTGRGMRIRRRDLIRVNGIPVFVLPLRCIFPRDLWIDTLPGSPSTEWRTDRIIGLLLAQDKNHNVYYRVTTSRFYSVPCRPSLSGAAVTLFVPQREATTAIQSSNVLGSSTLSSTRYVMSAQSAEVKIQPMLVCDVDVMSWCMVKWAITFSVPIDPAIAKVTYLKLKFQNQEVCTITLGLQDGECKPGARQDWSPFFKVKDKKSGMQAEHPARGFNCTLSEHVISVSSEPVSTPDPLTSPRVRSTFIVCVWKLPKLSS